MNDNEQRVFMTDEYLYGTRARVNAGFGLWQMGVSTSLHSVSAETVL